MQAKQTIRRVLEISAIALTLTLGSFLLENKPSYACSCSGLYRRFESAHIFRDSATVVFAGRVNNINRNHDFGDKVTFSTYHLNKGSEAVDSQEISLSSGEYGIGCGYRFKQNRAYFVYAHNKNGRLHTDGCSRTKPLMYAAVDIFELTMPPIP